MSWTNECTESNQFRVKNVEEVRNVLECMGFNVENQDNLISFSTSGEGVYFDDNTEVVLSIKPIPPTNENLIGLISDSIAESVDFDTLEEDYGLKQEEVLVIPIIEYLQDQLLTEEEYVIITCAGFESRCGGSFNPFGDVTVITQKNVKYSCLYNQAQNLLKEIRGF